MIDYRQFLKTDFKNKYRLLCPLSEFKVDKVAQLKSIPYLRRITITPKEI